jgi:predicted nucleic acid-binding protein
MRVYVETNFVLQLTLEQDGNEYTSCEQILSLCDSGKIQLVVPAFALAEVHNMLRANALRRKSSAEILQRELEQLNRSLFFKQANDFSEVVGLLEKVAIEERQRLAVVRERLLRVAEIIPLDSNILSRAVDYEDSHTLRLAPQDAIIYASILFHLDTSPPDVSCFLNRDNHFSDGDIKNTLKQHNCTLILKFSDGYNYIQSQLAV